MLDLRGILDDVGYAGSNPFTDGVLSFIPSGADTQIMVDADGSGAGLATTVATLLNANLTAADTDNYLV